LDNAAISTYITYRAKKSSIAFNFDYLFKYKITMNQRNIIIGLLCVLMAVVSTVAIAAPAPKMRAAPVVVAEAKTTQLAPVTWVAGTVISRDDAKLATEVEGRLKKVLQVGTRVKAGEVVALIDNTFVDLRIQEMKAAVEREKAQLTFLREEVKRLQRLAKQNNAAKTLLEQTQADRDIARNDLEIARTRLRQAKEEKWRHEIRAPFDGVIAERYTQAGERVDTGDVVVRLIDPATMEVQARVPLKSINFVGENSKIKLQVDQPQLIAVEGDVRTIVPVGDERSRLMDLRINFKDVNWRIGQPVRVALPTDAIKEVLAVPRDALVLRRSGTSVYRVNGESKAENIPVQVGIASGDLVEVTGKLNPGDKVVIRGGERLRPGQDVSIISN
jgi:RND family efflux transporter MFP subunit